METKARLQINSSNESLPREACLPLTYAQRWNSPYDMNGMQPAVSVFITQPAYIWTCVHASNEKEDEVGGALVGQWCADVQKKQQFIVIEHMLPARFTKRSPVHLTFTHESLLEFHRVMEARFTGKQIVGWYHTHPRMGLFLSSYDTWLHKYFFPEPWQVALVIEPHTSVGGFFIRQTNGSLDTARYFGFYELNGNLGHSLVRWYNLHRPEEEEGD